MKSNIPLNQPVTATESATRSATEDSSVQLVFKRPTSANWQTRYLIPEDVKGAFPDSPNGQKWKSTETEDKGQAELFAVQFLADCLRQSEMYRHFKIWAAIEVTRLPQTEAIQFALRLKTGYAWELYQEQRETQGQIMRVAAEALGLPIGESNSFVVTAPETTHSDATPLHTSGTTRTQQSSAPAVKTQSKSTGSKKLTPDGFEKLLTQLQSERARNGKPRKASSLSSWETVARDFMKFVVDTNQTEVHEALGLDYRDWLRERNLSANTQTTRLGALSGWFDTGKQLRIVTLNPFIKVKGLGAPQQDRECWQAPDMRTILTNLPSAEENPLLHWAVRIGAVTGMRGGEVTQLRPQDVMKSDGFVFVYVTPEGSKTEVPRWIPLHTSVADEFWGWFQEVGSKQPERIFNGVSLKAGLWSHNYNKAWRNLRKACGLYRKGMDFHSLRHSVETWQRGIEGMQDSYCRAMTGRAEKGSSNGYGTIADALTFAHIITKAQLWYDIKTKTLAAPVD
ncbi:tyrosine-type recombinase/integrase [Deefgea rivuli]|uniref:tyrosine-type recombinase/integrase n=1 Tax=Deefgea rivuli TaxID=400948 RepID=UPI0004807C7E|nr:tyrosine-type recombinase/integrase [Deefgea rivuli]